MRLSALAVFLFLLPASHVLAADEAKPLRDYVIRPEAAPIVVDSPRHFYTDLKGLKLDSEKRGVSLTAAKEDKNGKTVTGCLETSPYDDRPYAYHAGRLARLMANHSADYIETITIQPHYSGLKGPKLVLMRRDLERVFVQHQGSAQEIFHNTRLRPNGSAPCDREFSADWDLTIEHHLDAYDSGEAPLLRSDAIITGRLHMGRFLMGSLGLRLPLYDNLKKETGLYTLTRRDPVRQDVLGFAWKGVGLEYLMLSGFATPRPDTYVALHGGYLEEKFFGLGGEFLYRPHDSPFSFGGEIWATAKREPYLGNDFTVNTDNTQVSALANAWYDWPRTPLSFGLSAGRFLDGDAGAQGRILYRPAAGWRIEGFATFSDETETTLDGGTSSFSAGLRLTMPLGRLAFLPENSRQTIRIKPFARDKGQRIDNPYPLYGLTDPWSTQNLYRHWKAITQ